MTTSEKNTEAKDAEKPKNETTAPYLKKDNTSESAHTGSEKKKSSIALTISLLIAAVIIITITTYKFNEELNSISAQEVAQTSSQINTENTGTTSKVITPTSTNNNATDTHSTPERETIVNNNKVIQQRRLAYENGTEMHSRPEPEAVANNNNVTQQRRLAYENEKQLRLKKYQAMMTARQQDMIKTAETQKERYKRFRQNQLETRMEIQETQKQIYKLNEKLHYLIQRARTQNNR